MAEIKIDPDDITKFDRTQNELEAFLFFAIAVAGKNSDIQAKKVNDFIRDMPGDSVLGFFRNHPVAAYGLLQYHKLGKYNLLMQGMMAAARLDLKNCSIHDLELCPGIGPKTSRFFLIHSRQGVEVAVLDVWVLKWAYDRGLGKLYRSTPSKGRYALVEKEVIALMKEHYPNMSLAEADLQIWLERSGRLNAAA